MQFWKNLPIRLKLPMTFAVVSIVVTSIMFIGSSYISKGAQTKLSQENFALAGATRHDKIHTWLKSVEGSVVTASSGSQVIDALYGFSSAFKDLGPSAKEQLQADYIANNTYPPGLRAKLDRAPGDSYYHTVHSSHHKTFRTIIEQLSFYDLFLIDKAGNIVYTVAKEFDFGENLITGPLKDSNLASVAVKSLSGSASQYYFSHFEPYGPSGNASAMFVASPIVNDLGNVVGSLAVQLSMDIVTKILDQGNLAGTSSKIYMVSDTGIIMTNSLALDGVKQGDKAPDLVHISEGLKGSEKFYDNILLASGNFGFAATYQIETRGGSWLMVIERDLDDVMAAYDDLLMLEIILGATCFIISIGIGFLVSKTYSKPISTLNDEIRNVAAGDYDTKIKNTDGKDEFGAIAASLDDLRAALAVGKSEEDHREEKRQQQEIVVAQLTDALRNMAAGDLTQPIKEPFDQDYEILREHFNDALQKMDDAVSQISSASEDIKAQADEISRSSEELAHRTEVQAATLEQTAAAMDEMTASVKSATSGVEEVEGIVKEARKDADQSGVVVKEAVSAMAEIEKSSDQISQIIGVIDDIAFQTNLLALNAGVEAARAGDAGRGFAVVASEVGALAQRASSAAKEIKTLIGTSSEHVERGVERVKQAGEALQQIAKRVTHISTLTSDMATGAREQSIGLTEINLGMTQLDQATQKNAAMSEEATAASHLLKQGATELTDLVARFKLTGRQGASNLIDLSAFAAPVNDPQPVTLDEADTQMSTGTGGRGVWQDF